jgi:hypothetical protein
MPIFTNDIDLILAFEKDLDNIILNVTDQLLTILKDTVQQNVYDPYRSLVKEYRRTGEFKESWSMDKSNGFSPSITGVEIDNKLFYDPSNTNMPTVDLDNFQHGSQLSGDVRLALAEIINEGKAGPFFDFTHPPPYWWKSPRPFWDIFIGMLDGGLVFKLIEKEFTNLGISWRRI